MYICVGCIRVWLFLEISCLRNYVVLCCRVLPECVSLVMYMYIHCTVHVQCMCECMCTQQAQKVVYTCVL